MSKSVIIANRPRVYRQIARLQNAGKTELEIAEILGLTPATVRYVTSIDLPAGSPDRDDCGTTDDQRPRLAYEMRQRGKSFAEIGQAMQINMQRVRRMVHRYDWILRHSK